MPGQSGGRSRRRALALSRFDFAALAPRALVASGEPGAHRIDAAILFADISGYTRLAERLLVRGRAGTELLVDTIDSTFTDLIDLVHTTGGDVVRFGGDALFVVFRSPDRRQRVEQAVECALGMQAAMASRAAIDVPGGRVRLRQSVAVHDGEFTVFRWDGPWTEEVVFGEAVTTLLDLERRTRPGQVAVSPDVARIGELGVRPTTDGTLVVRSRSSLRPAPGVRPGDVQDHPEAWLPRRLAEAVRAGIDPEHRAAAIAFVGVDGLDSLTVAGHAGHARLVTDALAPVMDSIGAVAERLGVVPLCTDIAIDGIAVLLSAGALASEGDDVARLLGAAREVVAAGHGSAASVRAGLNAGTVFTALIGHPRRRTFAALGDTTNVAARIMRSAAAGTTVATAAALDQVAGRFATNWQEPLGVAGRRTPVRIGVVGEPGDASSAADRSVPFRGRAAEVRRLLAAVSRSGTTVVEVVGPLGSGKTRLVSEALAKQHRPVLHVACSVDDLGVPFAAARRLLAVAGTDPQVADEAMASVFEGPDRPVEFVRELVAERIARMVLAQLAGAPVFVVDLADHVDPGSRRVVERVVATYGGSDVAFVIVHRGAGSLTLAEDVFADVVEVGPLPDRDARSVVLDASDRPLGDTRLARLVTAAGGNPGVALRIAATGDSRELPADLTALMAVEVDRIPRNGRDVARAAAVVGNEFDHASVAAIADLPEVDVARALGDLDRVVQRVTATHSRFRDEALRVAIVESLPVRTRRRLARRLAEHLARDLSGAATADIETGTLIRIGRAWDAAEDDAMVVEWCGRAGRAAATIGAPEEAADLYGRAWRAARRAASGHLVDLAEAWSDAATACGRAEDAAAALVIASKLAPNAARRVELLARRARDASRAGRFRSAAAILAGADRLLPPAPRLPESEHAFVSIGLERARLAFDRGRLDDAAAAVDPVALAAAEAGFTREEAIALALADEIDAARGIDDLGSRGRRAYELALTIDDPLVAGSIACNLGLADDNRGDWAAAVDRYVAAEEHFHRAGSLWSVALTRLNRSTILLELGDADAAHATAADAYRELAAAGIAQAAWIAATHLARAAARRGDPIDPELARLRSGIARLQEFGDDEVVAFREAASVELLLLSGRGDEALATAARVNAESARFGDRHLLPITTRRLLAMAERGVGDLHRAGLDIERALAAARALPATGEVCLCLHAAQVIDRDRGVVTSAARVAELATLEANLGVVAHLLLPAPRAPGGPRPPVKPLRVGAAAPGR